MTFEKKLFASIAFLSITSFFFFSAGTVFAKGRSNPAVRQDLSSLLHARTYEPVVSQIQENDFSLADSSIPVAGGRMAAVNEHDLWLERAQHNPDIMHGKASWYGREAHAGPTASGLPYDMYTFTAAHRTLPIGTVVRVTDQYSGKSVMVCVTDRGPFIRGRIIDMSYAAAGSIGLNEKGVSNVGLEVVSDESGTPLSPEQAFYVRLKTPNGPDQLGPYRNFADAAAMHEAMLQAHPDAHVVLDKSR